MDFDDLPSIFINHNGKTCQFHTSVGHSAFVLALRHQFGADVVPDGKEIFLATETLGPSGESLPPRSFPLEDFLVNKAKSQRVFTLEFSDASGAVKAGPSDVVQRDAGFQSQAQNGREYAQRAAQIRKGRVMTDKTDANGKSLSARRKQRDALDTYRARGAGKLYTLLLEAGS